ncbi:MAG: hypothetical protein HN712_26805 [Gemmatimonadetes bacterium]|jgi:hypothetical protein|nr:hypothetical protein [Gemmatimonadota bacterium]MBT6149747.1 hypothetical protein [Gemmatimonadota bacterium]MBT7863951.1 hypothetical protein [Gemmatimonadota bacterium]
MPIIDFFTGNQRLLHLLGGFAVGLFIGFRVLPVWFATTPPDEGQQQALQAEAADLEEQIERAVVALDVVDIADANLTLSLDHRLRRRGQAVVTVHLRNDATTDQLDGMATLVASLVEGVAPGQVTLIDGTGRQLNKSSIQEYEQKVFWTGIAINIAKILGILAALITVKFIIRAVGRSADSEQDCGIG